MSLKDSARDVVVYLGRSAMRRHGYKSTDLGRCEGPARREFELALRSTICGVAVTADQRLSEPSRAVAMMAS